MLYRTKCDSHILKCSALVVLHFILGSGCSTKASKGELPPITNYIVDSVYLPITVANDQVKNIKELARGRYAPQEIIAFVRRSNYKLYTYDMEKGCYLDSIPLARYANDYIDFSAKSKDSIFIGQSNNTLTGLFNKEVRNWNINPIAQSIGKEAFIGYLSANSLQMFNDTVFCVTSTWEAKKEVGPNIPFIEANNYIMFLLKKDTVQYLTKYNPNPSYFRIQDYYNTTENIFINNHEVVYSFSHSDTLMLHNFATGKDKKVKLKTNNFFENKPFDYSRIMDYKYITEYEMEQSRLGFGTLYYNSTQHRIYQLMRHKGKYIEADGRKHDFEDFPQSLFVLDDQLNQLQEILIPPRTFESSAFTFTTYKGIYFAAHKSKQKYNDKMLFYRIVVK